MVFGSKKLIVSLGLMLPFGLAAMDRVICEQEKERLQRCSLQASRDLEQELQLKLSRLEAQLVQLNVSRKAAGTPIPSRNHLGPLDRSSFLACPAPFGKKSSIQEQKAVSNKAEGLAGWPAECVPSHEEMEQIALLEEDSQPQGTVSPLPDSMLFGRACQAFLWNCMQALGSEKCSLEESRRNAYLDFYSQLMSRVHTREFYTAQENRAAIVAGLRQCSWNVQRSMPLAVKFKIEAIIKTIIKQERQDLL